MSKIFSRLIISKKLELTIGFSFIFLISIFVLISFISFNSKISDYKNMNINLKNKIDFLNSISDKDLPGKSLLSSNLGSFLNNSSSNNNIKVDRSMPLSNGDISIWINEVNFIDLFSWLIDVNNQGGEITKLSVRRNSNESVSAQLTFKTNS